MKKLTPKSNRFVFPFLFLLLSVFLFTSCSEVPDKEDFSVSKFLDLRLSEYKPVHLEFSNVSDFLDNDKIEGNIITIVYDGINNRHAKIVCAHTTQSRGVYYVWRAFAKENNQLFQSSFTSIPFLMGEFKAEVNERYIDSWFKEKWFFYLESDSAEALKQIRNQVIEFFKNPGVINESVIDI